MKLIIGLGNPGEKYKDNRHNVGHMVIDELKTQKSKVKNMVAVKTDTFMNNSGEFVKKLVEQYKLNPANLWVIHDDLDIPLGSYKIQKGKGPKLHNGVNSIEESLGTDGFWRVRIGIENRFQIPTTKSVTLSKIQNPNRTSGEEYVLQDFTKEEVVQVEKVIKRVVEELCKKLATS